MGNDPAQGANVSTEVRSVDEIENSTEVAVGSGVFVELGGVTVQAAGLGGVTERRLVGREGVVSRRGPEADRGDLVVPLSSAVLIKVIREPVQRHVWDAGLAVIRLLAGGCAGSARA